MIRALASAARAFKRDGARYAGTDAAAEVVDAPRTAPLGGVARGAVALLSTQPITWAASLAATVFLPRYLSDHDMGQLGVALTVAGLAATVLCLGTTTSLVRRLAADPARAETEATAALVLLLGLSVPASVALALIWSLLGLGSADLSVLPIVVAGMICSTVVWNVLSTALIGKQQHARFAWLNASMAAISTFVGICVLVAGGDLVAYLVALVGTGLLLFVISWRVSGLRLDPAGLSRQNFARIAREGFPFLGWNVVTRLRGDLEVMLLVMFLAERSVGWWSVANRIVAIPLFIPTVVVTPLLPALSQSATDRTAFEHTLRRALVLVLIFTVPACASIMALAPAIPDVLGWQAEYQNAVPLMAALAISIPLIAIGSVLGTGLVALHDEHRWLVTSVLVTTLCGIANMLLIPSFNALLGNGAIGAALVRSLGEVAMITSALILLPRGTVDRSTLVIVARIMLAGFSTAAVISAVRPTSLPLAVVVGGAGYAAALLALRAVRISEIRTMLITVLDSRMVRQTAGTAR